MKEKVFFLVGLILLILVGLVFTTKYYSQKGTVVGDIYVSMKSGDVKRMAGVDVVLYKVDNPADILQQIENIHEQYLTPIEEAVKELGESVEVAQNRIDTHKVVRGVYSQKQVEEGLHEAKEKQLHIEQMKAEHNSKINDILTPLLFKKGNTDVNGHYEFTDIPYGKYFIFSKHRLSEDAVEWLYPIEVNNKETKIDLTNSTMTKGVFFLSHKEK